MEVSAYWGTASPSSPAEVALGKTMAGGRASLMEATESSALAVMTCWQRETEKKTNTHWATVLGRELYLFSFNLHASLAARTLWTRKGA